MNDAKQIYDQINNLLLHCKLYEAETLATEATRIFPQNYSIAERLAHVQLRREKYFDAEQNYKAIISKFRDRIHAWIGLINTLLLQGKIMDAESVANDAMTLFHKEFSILERVADVQFRKGMHREAQKSYESIIDRFPDKAQAWVGLTNVLLSQDKISDAEMVAGEAIILFPGEYSVLERFAHTLHRKGMHCYAERIFRIIIDRYPDKTNGWIGLTNVLLSQDKLDEAEGVAGKAKALFPEDFP
ncbi:tetratricopeptide repeat protein, partial [Fundidesulfovibrio magnetotacticus]|uniref:tetratricopeptide repeat protein n=1 Tax=Fundidesulfovibrio magnetotacticus TaxID=2730080 RepID=UPI001565BFA5